MAQLLTPISADFLLKFHSSSSPPRSISPHNAGRSRFSADRPCSTKPKNGFRITAVANDAVSQDEITEDYYAVLGLLPDATPQQIKKAYYNCMKECHPDLSGDDEDTTNFCMFINEVYTVLSDPVQRMVYDEIHGYVPTAMNPFLDESASKDHVFVDEFSCIGCKNCANIVPDVFGIEEDFGRARVCSQTGNPKFIQEAMESCPVDCIHWCSAAQLSLLEDEMQGVERVNVGLMLAGMGGASDVFRMASSRWEKNQAKILETVRIRIMKKNQSDTSGFWSSWDNVWGKPMNNQKTEEEVKEGAKRSATASRRWREYSRRGADRPPKFRLPEVASNKE